MNNELRDRIRELKKALEAMPGAPFTADGHHINALSCAAYDTVAAFEREETSTATTYSRSDLDELFEMWAPSLGFSCDELAKIKEQVCETLKGLDALREISDRVVATIDVSAPEKPADKEPG